MASPTRRSNQDLERHYFEKFRATAALQGTPTYSDKPDVILTSDRTIGIEVTNFYLASGDDEGSEQRQRPVRLQVLNAAQNHYRKGGGRNIDLWVTFNPKHPITSTRKAALARELAQLVTSVDPHPLGEIDRDLFNSSPELHSVWFNPREWPNPTWSANQVYSVELLSRAGLQNIVTQKEAKAADYKPCDVYWLIVVVDWVDPAQDQEIVGVRLGLTSHVFERIIVYKSGFEEIIDAKARAAVVPGSL